MRSCDQLLSSVGGLVFTCRPAGLAIHESIVAQTNVKDRLAKYAKLLANAVRFRLLALGAFDFGSTSPGAHEPNVIAQHNKDKT